MTASASRAKCLPGVSPSAQTLGRMKAIAKLIALVPMAVVLFLGNAYGSISFAGILYPRVVPRPYAEMIGAAAAGALVGGILVAYPLVRMFPSRYWLAALAISAPLMALRLSDLLAYWGSDQPAIIIMSVVELLLVPIGAAATSWLFAKLIPRPLPNAA